MRGGLGSVGDVVLCKEDYRCLLGLWVPTVLVPHKGVSCASNLSHSKHRLGIRDMRALTVMCLEGVNFVFYCHAQ